MHQTLKPRTNQTLAIVCAIVAAIAFTLTRPAPLGPAIVGILLGSAVGVLQRRSIVDARGTFQRAETALDVRRALMSTTAGKWAIAVQWSGAVIVVGFAVRMGNAVGGSVTGYALLMCVRDLMTLNAVGRLAQGSGAVEQ